MFSPAIFAIAAALPPFADPLQTPGQAPTQAKDVEVPTQATGVEVPTQGGVLVLTLDQALELALERNIGLQVQELASDVARFGFDGSWGSFDPVLSVDLSLSDSETESFNPGVGGAATFLDDTRSLDSSLLFPLTTGGDLTLSYFLSETESEAISPNGAFSNRAITDVISLTFRQPLLRGGGSTYSLSEQREARLAYRQELAQLRLVRLDLLKSVEDAYWDLVSAESQFAVSKESLSLSEQQLDQNRRRLDAGVGTEVEVLQSEADLATKREQLIERRVAVKDAADGLKLMLLPGTDTELWDTVIETATELPVINTEDLPTWQGALTAALERRPDLERARLEIEAAEERLIRAQSEQRAQLDFTLGSSARGFDSSGTEAFKTALGWDFPTHTAGLAFSYPIGNRAARNAERSSRAQLRSARLQHDDLQSTVASEIRSSHRSILYQAESVVAAETSVELARRQLEAEKARFREGLSTNFQVQEFQEDLTQAQFSLVQARTGFAKARVELARNQGTLRENDLAP